MAWLLSAYFLELIKSVRYGEKQISLEMLYSVVSWVYSETAGVRGEALLTAVTLPD